MRLWEREFNIVKNGLNGEQVISFVNNLIEKHRSSQEASSASLRSLLKKAVTDAEQLAISIKTKAQADAHAEATRMIGRARQDIQETRKRAELMAQKEAENIISVANRRAQIVEVESGQQASIFLLKAREDIEKEVVQEYQIVQSRLSASLQNLASEGQDIEAELKGKRAELWEKKQFALNEYKTVPGVDGTVIPSPDTSVPDN